jgi:hypothetical protein
MRSFTFGLAFILAALAAFAPTHSLAAGPGFQGECWSKTFYFYGTAGKGSASGLSAGNAKPFVDGDVMSIEAGTLITKVYSIVDVAITGTSNFDIGDDDDADGYVDGSLSMTLGTPGMYSWDAKFSGAYQRVQTAGATDALDIYVVPAAKYYSVAGKEIKLDVTGTNTAGSARVIVHGCKVGA